MQAGTSLSGELRQRALDSKCRRVLKYTTPEDGAAVTLRSLVKTVCLVSSFSV